MRSINFRSLLIVSLLIFAGQTVSAQNLNIKKPEGLKIESIKGKTVILSFNTTVENVSTKGVGVTIKKGKLYKDGKYAGSFKLLRKIKLKNKGDNMLKVEVKVTLEEDVDLMKEGLAVLMGKKTELHATGMFKATWFIFWKRFPFEMKENVSMNGMF